MKEMRFLSVLLLLLFSSCNFNYRFHSRPLPLTCTDLNQNVSFALTSPSFIAEELPSQKWWDIFQDPHLDQLIGIGLASHPDIHASIARIRLACYKAQEKRAAFFPKIDFNPDLSRQKISRTSPFFLPQFEYYTLINLELDFFYEIDLWCKNRSLYLAELDEMRAAWADEKAAELLLAATIAQNYFQLQIDLMRYQLVAQRGEAKKEAILLNKMLYESGVEPEFNSLQAKVDLARIEDLKDRLEKDIEIERHALFALSGNPGCIDIANLIACPEGILDQPFPLPPCLPIDLISRRPEITAQKWRIKKAGHLIKAAEAAFYPSFDLMASPAFLTTEISKLFTWASFNGAIQLAAHLPIFTAGKLEAELGIKHQEAEIEIEKYNQLILNAVNDVSDWLSSFRLAESRINELHMAVEDLECIYQLNKNAYENGISSYFPVLNTLDRLLLLQDDLTLAMRDRYIAAIGLMKALGGGYHECR